MKKMKIERAVYAAWDYELELEHLNEMSEKGWQLIQGGCFHTKYEWDDSVVYRYQLDHNMKIENRMRYVETYREQGWEYINSTFNGWHYFRKVYDPKKPAEEYEIYSDRPSREEMAGRLSKLMLILAIVIALLFAGSLAALISDPEMAMIGIVVEMLAVLILTGVGCMRMHSVGRGERSAKKFPITALVTVAVIGLVWFMVFAAAETQGWARWGQADDGYAEYPFEIILPDWVNISVQCYDSQEMTVAITGDNGFERVYEVNRDGLKDDAALVKHIGNLFLTPGNYVVRAECASAATELLIEIE